MSTKKTSVSFPLVNPHAAAIDVGSKFNMVCIGLEKEQIRSFGVFTEDHHQLAQWFQDHHIQTIAMESTGIYWKSLFLILQAYGFEVLLVNAAHIKNVRGKKSDVKDCQWIWQLHRAGLLQGSFQPDDFTESLRTYNRQRKNLIEGASQSVSRMQKALVLMNIQLPVVLSDITGKSGKAIIQAILNGQRNARQLAQLADPRVKASKSDIAKALTGHWHEQQLFTLRQHWEQYHFYQRQIAECDEQIETLLQAQTERQIQNDLAYEPQKKKYRNKNAPRFDIDKYVYQLSDGVDLMSIEGISFSTLLTLVAEVGLDLQKKFPSPKHFVSWLCLCPNNKVTGGKILSSRSRKNKNRLAHAFRQAANTVGRQKDNTPLSLFFRKLAYRKERKAAITATARKLATIVYIMLVNKVPYQPLGLEDYQKQVRKHKLKHIQRTIQKLGITSDELDFC